MPAVLQEVTVDGERCAGLNNVDRRGANFHAWENDLHVAFGIRHYGREWGRGDLVAARWVVRNTIERLDFNDFELFYSCARKSLNPIDLWSGIRPQNTLSLQWACDFMLVLQRITGEREYLEYGEYLLGILALYQQVWDPVFFPDEYLFGGSCRQNTDGEWNDGRQCRFVSTFADYYRATGNPHYLERAVAACRAGFALMDMAENHANGINRLQAHDGHFFPNGAGKNGAQPGQGYAPECIHHGLDYDPAGVRAAGWSGMNWSGGGALAAAAYLELLFGALHVDLGRRSVTPIDGVAVSHVRWAPHQVELTLSSSLQNLPAPYAEPRDITVTVEPGSAPVTIRANGRQLTVAPDAGRQSFAVTL